MFAFSEFPGQLIGLYIYIPGDVFQVYCKPYNPPEEWLSASIYVDYLGWVDIEEGLLLGV